jgi:hypothetical protein
MEIVQNEVESSTCRRSSFFLGNWRNGGCSCMLYETGSVWEESSRFIKTEGFCVESVLKEISCEYKFHVLAVF